MFAKATRGRKLAFGIFITVTMPLGCGIASAHSHHHYRHHHGVAHARIASWHGHRWRARGPVLQCVAFAKQESGVVLDGNAANWWDEAQGIYARGATPEVGAILSFRGAGRIRLGHVAVVTKVVNSREIEVDHSHWASNGIARGVSVIDVSAANDWTAVRVALARGDSYGSVYATNGFIYDHPPQTHVQLAAATDRQTIKPAQNLIAASLTPSLASTSDSPDPVAGQQRPQRQFRAQARRGWHRLLARRHDEHELAEQPPRHGLRLSLSYLPLFSQKQ